MRRPERQRKEYRTWQQCENRCIAAGSRLSYTLQDGQKGNPGYVGLSVNIVVLIIGSHFEARKRDGGDYLAVDTDGMDGRVRFNPYLAIAMILGTVLLYYVFWLWALNV